MKTDLVPFRITICGLSELCHHGAAGVSHVLTILDPGWPDPPDFAAWAPHRRTIWRFHDIIGEAEELAAPQAADVEKVLEFGRAARRDRVDHLLVHCHMGISRSTAAASILLAQHQPGRERDAFDHLWQIRPKSWPNSRMVRIADALLGRQGALVAAMQAHHARVARAYPDFAGSLRGGERECELP